MPDTLKVYRMEGPEGHLDTDLDTRLDMGFDPGRPLAEPEPPLSLDLPLGPNTSGAAEAASVPKDFGLEKEHPLFPLPFSVYLDGVSWAGKSISVTRMIVTPEGGDRLMLGTRHMACVYLRYPNFGISLDAEVEVVEAGPDGEAALQFTDPMGDHLPQLRYLINSYIAGDVVSLNGMLSYTGPTKSKLPVPVPTKAEGRKERFKSISVLTLSAVIAMVAAVVVFSRYTTGHEMHPVFVDRAGQQLRATVGGQIGFVNPEARQGDIVFSVNSNSGDVLNFQMPCDCEIAMQPGIAAGSTVLPADLVATVYQGDAPIDVNTMISVSGLSRAMRGDHLWLDFPGGRSVEVQAVPSAATRAATMSGDVFLPVTLQPVEEASLSPEDTGTSARLRITPNLSDRFGIN